jgi:nitrite reductase (NO-forming)
MVYVGVGGEIDSVVNPDLIVQPGSSVVITLLNGDGMQHDLVIPDFDFQTPLVNKKDDKVGVVFEVDADSSGTYPYFCSVAGHRQAGMEGKLFVSQP